MKLSFCSDVAIPSRSAESIFIMKMCDAFVRQGVSVALCLPDRNAADISKEELKEKNIFRFYGMKNTFQLIRIPWIGLPGKRLLYGILAVIKAIAQGYDIIYTRSLFAAFGAALFGRKHVIELHTPIRDVSAIDDLFLRFVFASKYMVKVIVITEALKKYYCKTYGLSPNIVFVASDAADDVLHSDVISLGTSELHVGYVGHLFPGRGIDLIIEMARKCSWAIFHCIGGTEKDIAYWQSQENLPCNLRFHGFVPHAVTQKYRNACDVLIAPYQRFVSIYKGEEQDISNWISPLKVFEYMASGKAIIASDLPVLREVLTDGDNAIICKMDSIDSWVAAFELLRQDAAFRKRLGYKAYAKFKENYTWEKRAQNILREIRNAH